MIGWLLKKATSSAAPAPQARQDTRAVPPADCAIWNDIRRALDQSPRAVERPRGRATDLR